MFHTTHKSHSHLTFSLNNPPQKQELTFFIRQHLETETCLTGIAQIILLHMIGTYTVNTHHKNKHIKSYIKAKGAIKNTH